MGDERAPVHTSHLTEMKAAYAKYISGKAVTDRERELAREFAGYVARDQSGTLRGSVLGRQ